MNRQQPSFSTQEWRKYSSRIYLALRGELQCFSYGDKEFDERSFLNSCFKNLGALSTKQINSLDRLLNRIFT